MKSCSHRRNLSALAERNAFFAFTIVLLTILSLGCTSRKQYAINEAILISERRQLEDEIYRTKFELRDALQENEQLRSRLESAGVKEEPSVKQTQEANKRPSIDENLYPGGTDLQVNPAKTAPAYQRMNDPDAYDNSPARNAETLPDFVPVPMQSDRYSQDASRTQSLPRSETASERETRIAAKPQQLPQAPQSARARAARPSDHMLGFGRPITQAQGLEPQNARSNVTQPTYRAPVKQQAPLTANAQTANAQTANAQTVNAQTANAQVSPLPVEEQGAPGFDDSWSPVN